MRQIDTVKNNSAVMTFITVKDEEITKGMREINNKSMSENDFMQLKKYSK